MFHERFSNKTNGVRPRRRLLLADPVLAGAISQAIGNGWITDLSQLSKLRPLTGIACSDPPNAALLTHGNYSMHLADLKSYLEADRHQVKLDADRGAWARKAILNVAGSGKFSTDRTIREYATEIWEVKPCPVP